jgi:hypothetical protein
MSHATPGDRLPLWGGWARNAAAGMVFVASLLCCAGAFWLGWSSGLRGEHKGDDAIRDILVAIALLAAGLASAVLFVGFFLLDIAVRVKQLSVQPRQRADDSKPGP